MMEKITGMMISVFSPIFALKPLVSILIFSTFLTVLFIVITRFTTNRKIMKEFKTKSAEMRENLTKAQKEGNQENANKVLGEYMELNNQYMKQTFKSLIISTILVLLFLPVFKSQYQGMMIAALPFSLPIVGSSMGWILWYFIVSLTMSWVIRKIIGE